MQHRGEGVAGGGSPGEAAGRPFPASPAVRLAHLESLSPIAINPWQAPGLLHLLSAELGRGEAEPCGTLRTRSEGWTAEAEGS